MSRLLVVILMVGVSTSTAAQDPRAHHTDDVARGLFEAGRASYDAGSYREALELFQRAYDHSQRPRLLYNIGQSADRLRMDRTALNAFRKYLELVPDADNKVEVENRVRALEDLVVDEPEPALRRTPAPAREPAPTTMVINQPSAPRSGGAGVAPWLVVGVGGAAAITGVVLFAVGRGQVNNVGQNPQWSEVRDDARTGPRYQNVGLLTMTLGAAAAAVGFAWIATSSESEATVAVGPGSVFVQGRL